MSDSRRSTRDYDGKFIICQSEPASVAVYVCVATVLQAKQCHYIPTAALVTVSLSLKVLWEAVMSLVKARCHPDTHTHIHTYKLPVGMAAWSHVGKKRARCICIYIIYIQYTYITYSQAKTICCITKNKYSLKG